jgi:nucleoid-associated protein YgaU
MSQSMLQNALVAAAIGGVGLATYLIVNRHVPQEVAAVSSQAEAPSPAPEPAPVAEAGAAPGAPSFDVVRVTPEGSALVAGRAEPGATVTIFAGDTPIAEAEVSPEGEFVTIFQTPPSATPQTLTLTANDLPSETTVLILPPPPPPPAEAETPVVLPMLPAEIPASVAPAPSVESTAEPTIAVAALPSEVVVPAEPAAQSDSAAETSAETVTVAPTQVAATAILRPDAPPEVTPTARENASVRSGVTLASISYADEGLVTLAGLGTAGSTLRVYVDDAFARDGVVEDDGRWAMQLDDVAAGVYRLRIDEVRSDGTVASRVETPFQRDIPSIPLGEATAPATPGSVTVQPGNNLWTLARIHYGAGTLYSQIFTANTDLIRDPDLIYPGQILALPEVDSTAPANLSASGLPLPRP